MLKILIEITFIIFCKVIVESKSHYYLPTQNTYFSIEFLGCFSVFTKQKQYVKEFFSYANQLLLPTMSISNQKIAFITINLNSIEFLFWITHPTTYQLGALSKRDVPKYYFIFVLRMTMAHKYKTNLLSMIAVVMRSSRRMVIANGVWKEFIMEMIKNCH